MTWELILLTVASIVVSALLVGTIYQIFCLGDLECDYINPYDLARRINALVSKEFVVQGVLCALFLLTRHWSMFLLSAPITYYHLKLYLKKKHLIDVTEVFRGLENEKQYRVVKLTFYMILFAIVIFRLVLIGAHVVVGEDVGLLHSIWTF